MVRRRTVRFFVVLWLRGARPFPHSDQLINSIEIINEIAFGPWASWKFNKFVREA